jgi:NADH-quinone oxidoreductase subunit N
MLGFTTMTILLERIIEDFKYLIPEGVICLIILVCLLVNVLIPSVKSGVLPVFFIIAQLLLLCILLEYTPAGSKVIFSGMLTLDKTALFFKLFFSLATIVLVSYALFQPVKEKFYSTHEFYIVLAGILLGLYLLSMSSGLLMMYIALELVSLGAYIISTFGFNGKSIESGLKYLLFGAVSSGIMLYGISLIYGLSGTLDFSGIALNGSPLMMVAFLLTLSGVLFKISGAPFHIWVPDVYEGTPAPVAAYFSIALKAAGFVLLFRLCGSLVKTNAFFTSPLVLILVIITVVTITAGNFSALWQNNPKRMLAYSSVAHTGFILSGMLTFSTTGFTASLYYLVVYLFMNFAAFLLVEFLTKLTGSEDVNKFKGLGMQVPVLGAIFVFIMIALTGLPPTAGFYAKFFVFSALWEAFSLTSNYIFLGLFVFGLLNTVISLFYYLKVPYLLFFKKPAAELSVSSSTAMNVFFIVLTAPLLVLFLKPELLLNYINYLFK